MFLQLRLALLNHTLSIVHLHVEVVQIERLEERHDIRENRLRVAIINDLLLSHDELGEEKVLVHLVRLVEVLLRESAHSQTLYAVE